jgi:hypothetical protein
MNLGLTTFFVGLLLAISQAAGATPQPPEGSVSNLRDLKVPETPYDETANADAAIARALARARVTHKRVLIDLGGNSCADCRILAGIMQLPEIRQFLDAHYVVVLVNVGRIDRNLQVPVRFGITRHFNAIPALLVTGASGRLLNRDHIWELGFARHLTPQSVAGWLAEWAG